VLKDYFFETIRPLLKQADRCEIQLRRQIDDLEEMREESPPPSRGRIYRQKRQPP
jgi:hypothetical protein